MDNPSIAQGPRTEDRSERPRPELVGQLGGQLAHDFNNVLAVTLTSVEVAMRIGDAAKANGFLNNAIEIIKRGRGLTDRLAAASQACETPVRIDAHATILALAREIEGNGTRVVTQLDASRHEITVDAGFFDRALRNLAANAREAMPEDGVVTFTTRDAPGAEVGGDKTQNYLAITVADRGRGMSEDVRQHAFDLFYSTKARESWRGTGLTQVKDTARRAGGVVAIESSPGRGTTVTFAIPAA